MDIRQLGYFLSVAEELHFGRAAERVHISQPPLSRQIMELEEELGVKLFDRTTRGVRLTPAGEYLKIEAQRILQQSELIKERIAQIGEEAGHRIRLGFVGSAIYSFLPELVGRLKKDKPELSFEFFELGSDEQAKALLSGKIDLGIIRSWIKEGGISFTPIAEETLSVVYADSLYQAVEGGSVLGNLARLPFITFSEACAPVLKEVGDRICARAGFSPQRAFISDHYDSVLRFVAAGLGWAIVPTLAYKNSRLDMRSIELADLPERIVIGVASREDESDPLILELIGDIKRTLASA
jgi:DNA-binding transcriptional LysR family regulator